MWLGNLELAGLLGITPATTRGGADGRTPRPGFRLVRKTEHEGSDNWNAADGLFKAGMDGCTHVGLAIMAANHSVVYAF